MAAKRCRFGKVKRGKRKGQCLKRKRSRPLKARRRKAARRGKRKCKFGVAKSGRRKGQCLKSRRSRKR